MVKGATHPVSLIAGWAGRGPQVQSLLRIAAALVFMTAGRAILFAFPAGMPPGGGTAPFPSQVWIGGFLEVVGGGLLLLGLFTPRRLDAPRRGR